MNRILGLILIAVLSALSINAFAADQSRLPLVIVGHNPNSTVTLSKCIILSERNHPPIEGVNYGTVPKGFNQQAKAYIEYMMPTPALEDTSNPMVITCELYMDGNIDKNKVDAICEARPHLSGPDEVPCVVRS